MATVISMNQSLAATKAASDQDPAVQEIRHGRLLYKLLAVFLPLAVLPLLLAAFQLLRVGERYIQGQIIDLKRGIAEKVAASVKGYIDDKRNTLQIVHKSGDFLTMNPRRQTEILGNVMNAYPMFMRMTVLDLNGKEIATVSRLPDAHSRIRHKTEALRAIRSLGDYTGPVTRSPEGYPQMTIAVPIEKIPGRPIGALFGIVNLIDLSSLVKDIAIDKSGYVYIVDMAHGQLISHPDIQTLLKSKAPPEVRAASLVPEENSAGGIEFTDENHERFLATYAKVPGLPWKVFVQEPTAEAYEALTSMRQEIVKIMIIVMLIALVVGVALSQMIVGRVQTLQRAMERVGEGNFDVPSVPFSNDEFGSLTEKFLWMARSLKDKTLRLVLAQKELQKWNSDLERRVEARTKDLKEAQDQLISQEKLAALGQMASVVGHELRNPLAVMNNSVYFLKTKLQSMLTGAHQPSTHQAVGRTPSSIDQRTGTSPVRGRDPAEAKDQRTGPSQNPAGAVKGGLMTDGPSSEEERAKIHKHLAIIESEIAKSNTIIRDVLDFARNRSINLTPQKLDELVEKAIERIQLPPKVTLKKELELGDLEVPVDEDEIRQVLVNLMENACQAMTSGGRLFVGTKAYNESVALTPSLSPEGRGGKSVEIVIADTGCGIPQEHLEKIFAPFFTTKSRGTGLGLAVVKKIIDRHKGVIQVVSKVGEGTAFHIRLPVQEQTHL